MSATAAALERPSRARERSGGRASAELSPVLGARLLAFCALALLAGLRFASLLAHPPLVRTFGVVAVAGLCAAALAATRTPTRAGVRRTVLRAAILVAAAFVAMLCAGAQAHALWPWHWDRLARLISDGFGTLDGRWPYDGGIAQSRVTVMLALPAAIVPAAALAFWPAARARARARARATALALLLVLYSTGAVNESHAGWQVQGALLLALLGAWGWAWRPRALALAPALACALAAAIAAILLAGVLASEKPLFDYRGWNVFGTAYQPTSFDWNQTYLPLAWPKSGETMVEVASPSPHLWRATTLDRFDGVRFERSGSPVTYGSAPPPALTLNPLYLERATFVIRGLRSTQLLSPGEALAASIAGVGLSHLAPIAADGSVSLSGLPAASGDRYTVTAYVPQPGVAALRAAPRVFPAAYAPDVEFGLPPGAHSRGTAVTVTAADASAIKASPYAEVFRLARRLAAGTHGTYEIVARIEAFLHRSFGYDESPPPSSYPLVSFLLYSRRGYCQQFSGAMTLLLRMDGVPARVAAGFLPGTLDRSTGLYRVSASDAHAWVEVFFAGIGWVPFDPTPPAPGEHAAAIAPETGVGAEAHRPALEANSARGGHAAHLAGTAGAQTAAAAVRTPLIAAALALALLLAGAWTLCTLRLRRAFAGDAAGATRELARAFARVGNPLAPGATLAQLERDLGPRAGGYVSILRERRYAIAADAAPLPSARDRRMLRRALRRGRGPRAWLRALLALPPGALPRRRSSGSPAAAGHRSHAAGLTE